MIVIVLLMKVLQPGEKKEKTIWIRFSDEAQLMKWKDGLDLSV